MLNIIIMLSFFFKYIINTKIMILHSTVLFDIFFLCEILNKTKFIAQNIEAVNYKNRKYNNYGPFTYGIATFENSPFGQQNNPTNKNGRIRSNLART